MMRRQFTRDFKLDVCRQIAEGSASKTKIKREYSLGNATLERWLEQYMARGEDAFDNCDWRPHRDEAETKVRKLEAALGRAHMEIEFLKECLGNLPRLRAKKQK